MLQSPRLRWAFTANHAHLVPEGIEGFVEAIPMDRLAEVRLADCFRNGKEEHLMIGEGNLDFGAMFSLLERRGFSGNYVNAFVSLEAMLKGREMLVGLARGAGVAVD